MLRVKNIEKYYGSKNNVTKALDRVSFDVADGEFMAMRFWMCWRRRAVMSVRLSNLSFI